MSHKATEWLAKIDPASITHGEFRVLFYLCDCHNPSAGCFPSQSYLRDHTALSNGGLNKALANLEDKGLLRRERDHDQRTHRRKSTRYILGFEIPEPIEPSTPSGDGDGATHLHSGGDGAISTSSVEPSPLLGQSHLHPSGDEPVREPVKEPCAAGATDAIEDSDIPDIVARFTKAYPRAGDAGKVETGLRAAIASGVDPETIIAAARSHADEQKGNAQRYIAYPENWLDRRGWERHVAALSASGYDPQAALESTAGLIRSGKVHLCRHVKSTTARELVRRGMVTPEQCRAVEVSL